MMTDFNPNDIGVPNGNYFGLPITPEDAEIVLIQVPWDVTTSYKPGTYGGPEAILNASTQIDLFDEHCSNAWEVSIGTIPAPERIQRLARENRKVAEKVIDQLVSGEVNEDIDSLTATVNSASEELNDYVYKNALELLKRGKFVGVVGGEHSVPYGLIKALSDFHDGFGILHIDAHADLRDAYEGFTFSHASIMYNVLNNIPQVKDITQVAVRDFCSDEYEIMSNNPKVRSFTGKMISGRLFSGDTWKSICDEIIDTLPDKIYISFDIDGLDPSLCPNTGTPVPGGLSYMQVVYLLERVALKGKKLIGFDLCEVAGVSDIESIDSNIGARILFQLSLLSRNIEY